MLLPVLNYTYLATGAIQTTAASYLFYKIYHGSKSGFAYTLIAFTMIDGVLKFVEFIIYAFPHPIYFKG
jgi:hypothetical protein